MAMSQQARRISAMNGGVSHNQRRELATKANQQSVNVRLKSGCDLIKPICIYDVCEKMGVKVTFSDIDMEGMYQQGKPPRIYLPSSIIRPIGRRAYTCAHELGHHVFGHGSTIDELAEERGQNSWELPNEFIADSFASHLLMPTLALRNAFAIRGILPEAATPIQLHLIASIFKVGYSTLLTHLRFGAEMISFVRYEKMKRIKLPAIRAEILGQITSRPLLTFDEQSNSPTIDAEVEHLLVVPTGVSCESDALQFAGNVALGAVFEAKRPGIVRIARPDGTWAAFARISRKNYVGHAGYRHLEDDTDD
jgi:Zn-dependent peptidase ImmA (M78 family)